MEKELISEYNKKFYGKDHSGEYSFIDFLCQHTEVTAPPVDENKAWKSFEKKVAKPSKRFYWMRVAASVAILTAISTTFYLLNIGPDSILVESTDSKVNVTFPDGSTGILNKNSKFAYPKSFSDTRTVALIGEGYFDIKKKPNPFIINTNGVSIKVLGTAFNVKSSENEVILFVERGLVAFMDNEQELAKISAGEYAIFEKNEGKVVLKEATKNILSWKNGVFVFDETPLSEVINELEAYYQVEFKLSNAKIGKCKVSATFDNLSITSVISVLETILDINTEVKDQSIKLIGKGC